MVINLISFCKSSHMQNSMTQCCSCRDDHFELTYELRGNNCPTHTGNNFQMWLKRENKCDEQ